MPAEPAARYCVVGNPIEHSLSPQIHQAFARQTGEHIEYTRLLAPTDRFVETVSEFLADGGQGLNVTVPFKEQAFAFAHSHSPRALVAGAVNTLVLTDEGLAADNTDGIGLVRDITSRLGVPLRGAQIVLLGAGGAARGIIEPLAQAGVSDLLIANRTVARAEKLVSDLRNALGPPGRPGKLSVSLTACSLQALAQTSAASMSDAAAAQTVIWINSTASSLSGEALDLPEKQLGRARLAYDLVYAARPTAFMRAASVAGCPLVSDGLGMLVEQAAESFMLWRGCQPQTAPVLAQLRHQTRR